MQTDKPVDKVWRIRNKETGELWRKSGTSVYTRKSPRFFTRRQDAQRIITRQLDSDVWEVAEYILVEVEEGHLWVTTLLLK